MTEDSPRVKEAYSQMQVFLEQAKKEADLKTKFLLLEKDLENFCKESKINDMIWAAIKENQESQDKLKSSGIQWGPIVERIITAIVIAGITALVIKGMSA